MGERQFLASTGFTEMSLIILLPQSCSHCKIVVTIKDNITKDTYPAEVKIWVTLLGKESHAAKVLVKVRGIADKCWEKEFVLPSLLS